VSRGFEIKNVLSGSRAFWIETAYLPYGRCWFHQLSKGGVYTGESQKDCYLEPSETPPPPPPPPSQPNSPCHTKVSFVGLDLYVFCGRVAATAFLLQRHDVLSEKSAQIMTRMDCLVVSLDGTCCTLNVLYEVIKLWTS
jgi:hypothetical protein